MPGLKPVMTPVSCLGEVICCPPTEVMTSPAMIPALSAGVPQSSPMISAPLATGATWAGTPAPSWFCRQTGADGWTGNPDDPWSCLSCLSRCCWGLLTWLAWPAGTSTPRKPVEPIWTDGLDFPLMICLAILQRLVDRDRETDVLASSCRSCPSRPRCSSRSPGHAVLASGPPESPCTMPALVCSMPCSVSLVAAPLSLAVIVLFMPVMEPTTAGKRPAP